MGNSFGRIFKISTWGESHGGALGVVIDGCPAGLELSADDIQLELNRRRPGQSDISTQRKEQDQAVVMSGVFEGLTLGTPIGIMIANTDARGKDYEALKHGYRPSHADWVYEQKYGHRDWKGGGRASARETAARVAAGAVAKKMLSVLAGIQTVAWVSAIGELEASPELNPTHAAVEANPVRCPDAQLAAEMQDLIKQIRKQGDSLGGVVSARVSKVPVGLGEPVFNKLTADLAQGLMSIPATRGVEFGLGFAATKLLGSQHNDPLVPKVGGTVGCETNNSGGIQGGISNAEDIILRVAFKPTATIMKNQKSVDKDGNAIQLKGRGRHDPCVLPRAVPIVEAMINLVLADHLLMNRSARMVW